MRLTKTNLLTILAAVFTLGSVAGHAQTTLADPDKTWDGIDLRKEEVLRYYAFDFKKTVPKVYGSLGGNAWHALFYLIPQFEMEKRQPGSIGQFDSQSEYIWKGALGMINGKKDCSDFVANALLRILHLYPNSPLLSDEKKAEAKAALLGYAYWYDEPTPAIGTSGTENHQMLLATAELLAGQLYPDETFTNVNQNGRWRAERAKARLLRWMDWRARFGWSEWISGHYYDEHLIGLFNLIDFAQDEEIRRKATDLVNIMLFELGTNGLREVYNPTQGRIYSTHILQPRGQFTNSIRFMGWGLGDYRYSLSMCGISMATSGYKPPKILTKIALDLPKEMENIQRSSLDFEEMPQYGIKPEAEENYGLYTGMGYGGIKPYTPYALGFMSPESAKYKELKTLLGNPANAQKPLEWSLRHPTLMRVQPYTFRTPEFMLSCAQDYRKGWLGYQQHIWHATLGGDAGVFTTNPNENYRTDRWAGNLVMPKAVAYRNVLVCLYNPPSDEAIQKTGIKPAPVSHAWFPRFAFDEVVEKNGWVFGRKGDAYVALYSQNPATWLEPDPKILEHFDLTPDKPNVQYDYYVNQAQNAWICELGNPALHGSFQQFVEKISSAKVDGDVTHFTYQSPSVGLVDAGWDRPTTVAGKTVETRSPFRFNNPYCKAEFNTGKYEIQFQGEKLKIDFNIR